MKFTLQQHKLKKIKHGNYREKKLKIWIIKT